MTIGEIKWESLVVGILFVTNLLLAGMAISQYYKHRNIDSVMQQIGQVINRHAQLLNKLSEEK